MKRQVLALVVGLFTLAATATAVAAAPGEVALGDTVTVPEVDWHECKRPNRQGFDCARYRVPLDYDRPNGRTIGIKMVKLPAADQENKLGTIFLNPGGPGGSGVDFVLGAGPFLFTQEVRALYDLVGFDPRGIARSRPVRCFETFDEALLSFPPFAFPIGPEQEAAEMAAVEYLAEACAKNANGRIINHMSTANVARDMDRMRQAVGDDHLNYAGYSYGSYLGQVYANLFPDNVGRLYIDAILDPLAWLNEGGATPFSEALRSDVGAQDTLDEFFRLCDAAGPSYCALAPYSSDRFDYMAAVLWEEGYVLITDPGGNEFPFLYSDLIGSSLGPLYDSFGWPFHAEFLAFIESQIRPSTIAEPNADLDQIQAGFDAIATERAKRDRYPNVVEGFPGVACSDTNNPDEYSVWPESGAAADAAYGYFGRLWTHASVPCWLWPGADGDRYEGSFTADTANTVLIGSTTYDPATRYQGAVSVHDLLPNSALMTVEGWGHTTIFLSFCADQIVADYFLTGATPAAGTVCQQDFIPFLVPFDGDLAGDLLNRQALRRAALEEMSYTPHR